MSQDRDEQTLEGSCDALLVLRASCAAEVTERLASDPWTTNGLLNTKQISPWHLRLGSVERKVRRR